ncbi:MAG: N-acetylglucosamine-binding protein GbpA [Pseudomonas sp.]|uniref:N-acetylglucosamine-binding protein GbpA n=1 Tax=Pseudomonas sp. TaxID=306 RepID=UPI003397162B
MEVKKSNVIIAGCALLASSSLWAHGYISMPEARGYLCKQGGNSNCGAIQWEPQSLEAVSGFPAQGPVDGQIAGAGLAQFGELNEQTSSRWSKRAMQAGPNSFSWQFTANHATRNWRYYITKADWNPNQKLSRAAFELTPFCVVDGGMKQPPKQVTHTCNVPARSGYQVVLGVWEIGDTVNSFYNVVDVMFKDSVPQPPVAWAQKGTIYPSVDLKAGDSVVSRVFDASGERRDLQTKVAIGNATEGQRNNWAYQLAARINAEQPLLRAGQMDQSGKVSPVYGQNAIYTKADSNLSRVEVQINKDQPPVTADFMVSYLKPAYRITKGQLSIDFSLTAVGELDVSAYVYDHGGASKGFATVALNNNALPVVLKLNQPKAGHHQLVIKAVVKGSGEVLQKTFDLMLSDDSAGTGQDYVFPDGLRSYKAGTRVLQPKTGLVYVCKPFPNSGYCVQWSPSSTHYEPGIGSHWQSAWTPQ